MEKNTYLCKRNKFNTKIYSTMGYTHYWNFSGKVAPKDIERGAEKFARASEIIKTCLAKVTAKGVKIGDALGRSLKPIINDTEVLFNGYLDKSCETFYISLDRGGWDFCKTAREPYDLLVCLSLLAFKYAFGDDFKYTSDGITKEDYENRESNEYWKRTGYVPKGVEQEWQAAYDMWDEVKAELELTE